MNPETARKYILLEHSGELPAGKRRRLHRYLETSEEARAFRQNLHALTQAARETPQPAVSEFVLNRIREEGRQACAGARPGPAVRGSPDAPLHWRPALVYASILALAVSGWLVLTRPSREEFVVPAETPRSAGILEWDDPFEEQLGDLVDQLASIGTDETAPDAELDAIAAELLALEGSAI